MSDLEQEIFTDPPSDSVGSDYRAVSATAIASLLVSLLSLLAFWHPILWIVPVASVALSLLAILRIDRRESELIGRRLAVFAMCLSLVALSAAASRYGLLNHRGRVAARELGFRWFEALREGHPELASQLEMEPSKREPDGADLVEFYRSEPGATEHLRQFVSDPVVKAVLKLGPTARVRYIETTEHLDDGRKERLFGVYAVSYEEEGELKSFFVRLGLTRFAAAPRQAAQWWVSRHTLLNDPPNLLRPAG